MTEKQTKNNKNTGKILVIILVIIACLIGGGCFYVQHNLMNVKSFPSETSINNVDVSGLTVNEAAKKLRDSRNDVTLTITENGNEAGKIADPDLSYDNIEKSISACLNPGFTDAALRFLFKSKRKYEIDMVPNAKSAVNFNKQVNALPIVKNFKYTKKSKNAYVDLSSTDFKVVPEEYGNNLDKEKLKKALIHAFSKGESTFAFVPSKYYAEPKIKSNSKEIQDRLDYCKKYLATKITYKGPEGKYTISPADLNKMIDASSGEIRVKDDQVRKFVTQLAAKMTTVGKTRRLKSRDGHMFTVTGGDYGYILDQEKEAAQLSKDLASGKDITRKPNYSQKGNGNGSNDIGNTYVEISIGKQHLWVVKDNKVVVSTAVVTGNPNNGHATPTGSFYVKYKTTNATLKGRNADGSDYESHVAYWMPFYGDIGMHDANWRSSFGGKIYCGNGSHGCVNCPPPITGKIFRNVTDGTPVIVH